jgi:hypothetical protein
LQEDGVQYAIYLQETEMELRGLQRHLIKFTVVFQEEKKFTAACWRKGTAKAFTI